MSRLIFVPQYPSKMRYQETWYDEFPKQFKKYFDEVIVLGGEFIEMYLDENIEYDSKMFSPINEAVNLAKKYVDEKSGKFINGVLSHFVIKE